MKRIRLVFVLLTVALLVPGVLLVRRALESVEVEQAARHRTVAERVFDEMERFLSTFLVGEEARPVGHYRHAWSPAGSPAGVLLRSPLADPPDRPFVVGYFEIDGDGRVHTPLQPRDGDGPDGWPEPSDAARAAAARVLALVAEAWPQVPLPAATQPEVQQPGTTVAVGRAARVEEAGTKKEKGVVAEAYDAIQSLNRGAELRSKRSQKVVPAEGPRIAQQKLGVARSDAPVPSDGDRLLGSATAGAAAAAEAAPPSALAAAEAARPSPLAAAEAARPSPLAAGSEAQQRLAAKEADDARFARSGASGERFAQAQGGSFAEEAVSALRAPSAAPGGLAHAEREEAGVADDVGRSDFDRQRDEGAPSTPAEPSAPGADGAPAAARPVSGARAPEPVVIDPMLGLELDGRHLVLYRTVWRGPRAFRQGLILDAAALEGSLLEQALPSGAIPGARAAIGVGEPGGAANGEALYRYRHRFAEPFDALHVDLALPPLAGAGGARTIMLLSLALLLTGTIGLFVLYRMIGVIVGFSERRSNFVAAVSHELKTPLTSIRMYAEMLRDGIVAGDDKRLEYYGTITAESERLSRLIDNVLEFSRLERGTREMSWSVGDLGEVAREAVAVLAPHAEAQGFALEVDVEPELPPVRFDRDAVLQVIFNLVDNALKYARDARDKRIVIACAGEGAGVSLAVRDHGPGVASEHVKRIFEPFYRGESELTRRAQGTGIGLSLVRGLAEQMGARLRAQNRSEGGFEIRLSFQAAEAAASS